MSVPTPLPSLAVEEVPIDQLRPDPANPRRISEDELDSLERSIRQFGFVQPVLARKEDGTVIGGHQRLVAARRLGLKTVPVTFLDLSIEQTRPLMKRTRQHRLASRPGVGRAQRAESAPDGYVADGGFIAAPGAHRRYMQPGL